MLRQISWWKWLSVILLLYTFLAGLLIPLGPGITSVNPNNLNVADSMPLGISAYNTRFDEASEISVWLRIPPAFAIEADEVTKVSANELIAHFRVPPHLPVEKEVVPATLVIDSDADGFFIMPDAVFLTQDSANSRLGEALWDRTIAGTHSREGITFPFRNILVESIRNTYFHVALWFAMMLIFLLSLVNSIRYLRTGKFIHDQKAVSYAEAGLLFGLLGIATGAVWARYTWGAFWSWDIKQNMAAIAILIYLAYFVLRSSVDDLDKRARLGAAYNIFAFSMLIPLLYIIPRLTDSLHPGSGGNPALGGEDLDNTMRAIFYPAILGWTLFGSWLAQIRYRSLALFESYRNKVDV
jgi:heme exporter protein C